MAYLKNIDTKQIDNLVKKYEQKHKKKISMYYLTEYNEKTKQIKGEKMFMGDFMERLKKDVIEKDFVNECKLIKKGEKGQLGGGLSANLFATLSNITLAISTIYVVCVADSAAFTGLYAGFTTLMNGECHSFAETVFRWWGLGNPVCNSWSSIVGNFLLFIARDPQAIANVIAACTVIMKARSWVPIMHATWLKSVAKVLVLGGVMDEEEYDRLDDITSLLPALTVQERAMLEDEMPDMSDVF